ncbi:MAG: acetate--CoA ligase [bacterium]
MSDNIESVLTETRTFEPSAEFVDQATITADKLAELYAQAEADHEGFWAQRAREEILWETPFNTILDGSRAPHYGWFTDGKLNVSYNCLDRHIDTQGDKTALIFEKDTGETLTYSYRELLDEVSQFANALKAKGIGKGDRVVIYMPMIPEAIVAMQACARIGAIHSVVFGGFSSKALRDRIVDASAKAVITADAGLRGGKTIPLKKACDEALNDDCDCVETVIVYERTGDAVNMKEGRDIHWNDAIEGMSTECEPEWVDAEHPLFLLYTSGSTGNPKGVQHSSGGYLLNAILTNKWVFDMKPDDVFWCTADVGWITGHTYVAYGPLAVGVTQVIFEGVPTYPDGGRFWKMVQDHKVNTFYTAPTAIRALMRFGDDLPNQYDLSSLRLLGTVGEPINPEAWMWYYNVIGKQRCPIVDTWWQTETGAHMIAPIPGAMAIKPGSCTKPLPGIAADVVDEDGNVIDNPDQGGYLVIKKPWPSMIRTVWGDDQRYADTYWPMFDGKYYLAGDSATKDKDGYFWIMGRIDDVLNVSGHRLGTMEIESALVSHPRVAEAAVVGRPDPIKGEGVVAYVICTGDRPTGVDAENLSAELRSWVQKEIGPIAKPDQITFAEGLPKTRSGKIMRRLLKAIAKGEEITQDTSTLENEAVVKQLQGKA